MSTLEFIAALTAALAWPVALTVVVLLLRSYIPALLRSLRKVKVSGFEIELERTKADVEAALSDEAATAALEATPPPSPHAVADPIGTVIRQYSRLERELKRRLSEAGVADLDRRSGTQLVALGVKNGLFTEASAEAVRGVSVLRNLAAHGSASELTPEKVAEYEALIEAVIFSLRQKPKED